MDTDQMTEEARGLPAPAFPAAGIGREGYLVPEVDEYVGQLRRALDSRPPAMAPYEVADQRFTVTRWRKGYSLRAVDEYLGQAQSLLRDRHGNDPVAALEGEPDLHRHFPTGWIYLVALGLVVVIVAVAVSQL